MTMWSWQQMHEAGPDRPAASEPLKPLGLGDLSDPDSFNGAVMLYVVDGDLAAAEAIAPLAGRPIKIKVTEHAFPGRIYGFKSRKAFLPCLRIDIQKAEE